METENFREVLKCVDSGKNMLSSLLNDQRIVKSHEDVDTVITELCRMAALSLIKMEPIEDTEKDIKILLTELGRSYLKYVKSS